MSGGSPNRACPSARRGELEQEKFAGLKGAKISGGWRPEIDLRKIRLPPQHVEPVAIRDGDDEVDCHPTPPPPSRGRPPAPAPRLAARREGGGGWRP